MNNNDKWKSLWQPTLNKCFDDGNVVIQNNVHLVVFIRFLKEVIYFIKLCLS